MLIEKIINTGLFSSEPTLRIVGKVDNSIFEMSKKGLKTPLNINSVCLFASYSPMDIPFNTKFETIFEEDNPQNFSYSKSAITSATQQFGFPEENIPKGWKTIVVIEFLDEIPKLIVNIPYAEDWFSPNIKPIIFSSESFYQKYYSLFYAQELE